ncbi:MAG: L-threonylcarbamoyladenylate synthase [Acidobacteriota bacterium]|nr:L-threonylcarbamoyladenylate synthase [Acidobacteriota bacterium]
MRLANGSVGHSRHRTSGGIAAFHPSMIITSNRQSQIQSAEIIRCGGVIAFRTDTFYGLGADPFNKSAVRQIRRLKGREDDKPILLLISDPSEVDRFIINQSQLFKEVANRFWPGRLTIVGIASAAIPIESTAGTNTIGLRLPDDEDLRALVRKCGGALTATSANISGQPPAQTAKDVENYFPQGIHLIIDGGEVTATQPSTVLDLSGAKPSLIREGAVTRGELEGFGVR